MFKIFKKITAAFCALAVTASCIGSLGVSAEDMTFSNEMPVSSTELSACTDSVTLAAESETPESFSPAKILITVSDENMIHIIWKSVEGADGYCVQYRKSGTTDWQELYIHASSNEAQINYLFTGTEYDIVVLPKVSGSYPNFTDSDIVKVSTKLPLPCCPTTKLTIRGTAAELVWDSVVYAESYKAYLREKGASEWEIIRSCNENSTTFSDLTVGTTYEYMVTSVNKTGETEEANRNIFSFTVKEPLPKPVFTATSDIYEVTLNWSPVSDAKAYRVLYNRDGTSVWFETLNITGTSYTVSGLIANTKYNFEVLSVNGMYVSPFSESDSITVSTKPATPDLPQFKVTVSNTTATVQWNTVSRADKYKLYVREHGSSTWLVSSFYTGNTATVRDLAVGKKYDFLVTAWNEAGESIYDDSDFVAKVVNGSIELPTFTATPDINSVFLKWDAVSGVSDYRVLYRENGAVSWSQEDTTETSFTVTGLKDGTKYEFVVLSVIGYAASDYTYSNVITVTTKTAPVPEQPTLTVTVNGNAAVLSWNAVANANKYMVYVREYGASAWQRVESCNTASFTVSELTGGKSYEFLVTAWNNAGESKYTSADIVIKYISASAPAAPALPYFTATAGTNSVSLRWNAVSGAKSYRVYYRLNGGVKWTGSRNTTGTAVTISNLTGGRKYDFLVLAYNGKFSNWTSSDVKIVTPNAANLALPRLTLTPGVNKMTLKWNAVTGARSYRVYYRLNGTTKWTSRNTTGTAVTISNLTGGRKYDFLVLAYNGTFSKWTNSDIKVAAPTAGNKPVFSSVTPGVNSVVLRWNVVSGAQSYRVFYRVSGTSTWSCRNTSVNAMNLKGLTGGKTYEFMVRSYNGTTWSSYTSADIVKATIKS